MLYLIRPIKITIYFLLAWVFLLFLIFSRMVSMGLLSFTAAAFLDFAYAPWVVNSIKSAQYGLPTATLVASGLFSTLSLALPAILLALPVLFRFWKEGLPAPFILTGRILSKAPFFWWSMILAGIFLHFGWQPAQDPLVPFLIAFVYYSFLGITFLRKPRPWPAQVSFVLMASGAHLVFETVMAWPGIGPLLFNSILQQDHILTSVIFLAILSLVMLINWVLSLGDEVKRVFWGEEIK